MLSVRTFKNHEFRLLDGLFSRAASVKALNDRAIDVNLDEGACYFTYYRAENAAPYLQFVIRRVGPKTSMYELYKEGKGRITKSGLFERTYERLVEEVEALME